MHCITDNAMFRYRWWRMLFCTIGKFRIQRPYLTQDLIQLEKSYRFHHTHAEKYVFSAANNQPSNSFPLSYFKLLYIL